MSSRCIFLVLLDGDLVDSPEHLGVSLLVAKLREAGAEAKLVDCLPGRDDQVVEEIGDYRPTLVGISLTSVNIERAQQIGESLRARLGSDTMILLGGPIPTFCGAQMFEMPAWGFADAIFRGEAEGQICDILKLATGEASHDNIPGFWPRRGPPPLLPVATVRDIETLPWPARDQFENDPRFPYLRISTTRGCTSACTFCNAPHAGNNIARSKLWRQRTPKSVVDELEHLSSAYGVDTFDFVDSTFEDPSGSVIGKRRVEEISEEIIRRDLKIYFNVCCQAINWHEEDRPLIRLMHQAGLEKVLIGVESGHEPALRRYQKRATVDDNARAIRLFRERNIYVAFGFIMFDPMADFEEIEANAQFLNENIGHNLRRYLTRLELYPGAAMIDQLEREGLLDESYHDGLNPYAYRFADPRIGKLAADMARIISNEYLHNGSALSESPVVAFETFSIETHTLLTRLQRIFGGRAGVDDLLSVGQAEIDEVHNRLADENHHFFMRCVEAARKDTPLSPDYISSTNQRYHQSTEILRTIKLRLLMRLRRAGVDVSALQVDRDREIA